MDHLKRIIWKITPPLSHKIIRYCYLLARLVPNIIYDTRRYLIFSGINRSNINKGQQSARIIMSYHQIEKGLSLSDPRPGFGKDAIVRLIDELQPFLNAYGVAPPATTGLAVLREYFAFNERAGCDVDDVRKKYDKLKDTFQLDNYDLQKWTGGTILVSRNEIEAKRNINFKEFFNSRHSVRHYTGDNISNEIIKEATEIAMKTPSVCNRQAWRVHSYSNRKDIDLLLRIQNGSRGFGEQSSVVLVVTCDLTCFVEVSERYQAWIDGGMFSMSLCLALHSLGYGACCLNWSKERSTDIEFRRTFKLPDSEQVIMLISVGTLPQYFQVATSQRSDVDRLLTFY